MMIYRVIDLIVREDTFKLFTNRSGSSVFDALEEAPRIKTVEDFENRIRGYFNRILQMASEDSLYFNEACRMLNFAERVFKELRELNDFVIDSGIKNPMDDVVRMYEESLKRFVEDVDAPVVREHVKFIIS
ncbi:hypothetical protein CWI42_121560 [Ordospora colligata]|uniref:Uncharacterized protein n=1 Tax=Ordospora colligata OC4 TaxID=1354746 RepID=A0A0B2UHW3_9MICR|nr:uncharacterized protein M896_121560 [Ordospora colligata OC4]KHN68933.1 hypothetical protein M896_121560 [Ordospora colligata OC4]TBU13967.1 hypothetical protein CWI40_121560 [Ordospora colligata]TBU14156.1 hypothetical protein CWI41_121560 [Ordospora colligata]TBU17825.1 hypothetical protein CWI42_121560 [Ordospora colligata]